MTLDDPNPPAAPELDTATALQLGVATFNFLARRGQDADMDDFEWEDAGVNIHSGFLELDSEVAFRVRAIAAADERA